MLRRLFTLLLMLCLAAGAAARGCPMAAAVPLDSATANTDAAAHAGMPDCPHAKAARAAAMTIDDASPETPDTATAGCDHCKQCRVQVPPVDIALLPARVPPIQVTAFEIPSPPLRMTAPLLRPPISSRPAHHA
jgi:hypothetical protein